MEWYYALAEFYLSLIAYFVLHMIFVIASDFVEAFNIPPLNIGIYVDKLAAIRALLMVLADILEWAITQRWLGDPGSFKKLTDPSYRRIGSVLSFIVMLMCRIVYLWLIYKSDNKSLTVFVTLCIEGFWFGVFQMSFFAIGPEYNAFTSFGIHTMGNFIFLLQLLLNKLAKSYPSINCLYRVRVHGWIVVVTSVIALPIWIVVCSFYTYGHEGVKPDEVKKKVDELKTKIAEAQVTLDGLDITDSDVSTALAKKMNTVKDNEVKNLVNKIYSRVTGVTQVTAETSKSTVTVQLTGSGAGTHSWKVKLSVTGSSGGSGSFNDLVEKLKTQLQSVTALTATELQSKLNGGEVPTKIKALAHAIDTSGSFTNNPTVSPDGNKVIVSLTGEGTGSGTDTKTVTVSGGGSSITVVFNVNGASSGKAKQIASALALAMTNDTVTKAVEKNGWNISLHNGGSAVVEIKVTGASSGAHAKRIAKLIEKSISEVSVKSASDGTGPQKIKLSVHRAKSIDNAHVWSPLLLFIVGAFAEDFSVPGVLPFAFLDPEKANLVNYLTPAFFMSGAMVVVFLNDVFSESGFAIQLNGTASLDSWFKEWSEGEAPYWHFVWALNIPKYIAFFIAMWSIHGTFDYLRCIIQSRWRVLVLTMTVVVFRATLEVMGYVGVANYAIACSEAGDYDGFDYIVIHDVLAMFCRFVYGKFAVGYKLTVVYFKHTVYDICQHYVVI